MTETDPNPYADLPDAAFWRAGVVETDRAAWPNLYLPKVDIGADTAVATAGSCFAQHIGRHLAATGVNVLDAEPAPRTMPPDLAKQYHYGVYSARYGNIYTARQLRELLADAAQTRVLKKLFWTRDGRHYDALRPAVEPKGCDTLDEAMELRRAHLLAVSALIESTDVFVFTLGLTEAWIDRRLKRTLPMAAGVIAGRHRDRRFYLHNYTYAEILDDLHDIRAALKAANPSIQMLLTVSPVPLTATASGAHVLAATTYSKAVLRAVAGDFAAAHDDVDYFPSYELVTTWAQTERAFADNLRSVRPEMVARVMSVFLAAHGLEETKAVTPSAHAVKARAEDDEEGADALVCEEALLDAMRK